MTRISDRIVPTGLLSSRKYHQQKYPNCIIWQHEHVAAIADYWRQKAMGAGGEVIGCMRPLLRARDRIRRGLAWTGVLIEIDRLVPEGD